MPSCWSEIYRDNSVKQRGCADGRIEMTGDRQWNITIPLTFNYFCSLFKCGLILSRMVSVEL